MFVLVPATPEDGDIVIRVEHRDGERVYLLHSTRGPDQILVRSQAQATASAVASARHEHGRVWLDDGRQCVLLEDFRTTKRAR
jgi:hypothetical protein